MVFNNNLLLGASGQSTGPVPFDPTLISNSVWLDGSADYLEKTFSSAPGSQSGKRYVWAVWVQPPGIFSGTVFPVWSAGTSASNAYTELSFYNQQSGGGDVEFNSYNGGGSYDFRLRPTQVFRDIGWQHFLVSYDSTQAIASNRIKIYFNGEEITSFAQSDYPSLNHVDFPGTATGHYIGSRITSTKYKNYSGTTCLLDSKSIQNGDVAVTDFLDTFTFGTNGSQYVPKADADIAALATTAGGNSFCLDFADSADLGNDISSNANDFTPNSMSSANQSISTPSLNYAVLNILDKGSSTTTSEGATRQPTATDHVILSSMLIPTTGKWAISGRVDAGDFSFGICTPAHTRTSKIGRTNDSWGAIDAPGASFFRSEHDSVGTNSTVISSINDTFIIAFDADSGKLWLGRNHNGAGIAYLGGGDPTTGATPTYTLSASEMSPGLHFAVGSQLTVSFGQRTHFETLPTDFLELNSANLTAPDYQGIDYFNATLYTGNGTAIGSGGKAVTGTGFQPDLVWIKNRDAADSHILTDVVRGVTKYISSNSFNAEVTNVESLSTFDTDGFTVGNLDAVNTNTEDYVSWNWLAGGTGSSNTDGSITSTVTVAGAGHFSIGTYTGTGANATIGHGLGGAPEMIIVKNTGTAENWPVYHNGIASDAETDVLFLNNTLAASDSPVYWNDTAPTSSVFTVGTDNSVNASSGTLIFFAFRSVPGVCKVGSYIGNSSTAGPYISLGFKPRWWLVKETTVSDSAHDWFVADSARYTYNGTTTAGGLNGGTLEANDTTVEEAHSTNFGNNPAFDFLSDGIKLRTNSGVINATGRTYIYIAMADIGGNGTLPPVYGR